MSKFEEYERRRKILKHLEDASFDLRLAFALERTNYKKKEIRQIYVRLNKIIGKIYKENFSDRS